MWRQMLPVHNITYKDFLFSYISFIQIKLNLRSLKSVCNFSTISDTQREMFKLVAI